ncbi:MAG: hypothetical protein PHW62_01135 [Candidatus Ratteibacteria bacterium]|nr:hypothetical protein [Candidatus Ratteibacteria bacterium]
MIDFQGTLVEPINSILTQIGHFTVSVLKVLLILLVGWLISKFIIQFGITKILKFLKLDKLSKRIEFETILKKGGIDISLSELVGVICYWIALLVTFIVALNAAGLTTAAELLNQIVLFIPNIIAAIFILVAGMLVAVVLKTIVKTASSNAGIAQAKLLSKITEVVVVVFAIAMALEQLQIGATVINTLITIVLGAIGLGFALALGLGCKDIVGKSVSGFIDRLKK